MPHGPGRPPEGRGPEKKGREGHSGEGAVDHGWLVAAQSTQDNHDSDRWEPPLAAAREHEPEGITAVDADSGDYRGYVMGGLLAAGLDTCIPAPHPAAALHRGRPLGATRDSARGTVPCTDEASAEGYRGPEGNVLRLRQPRSHRGQEIRIYRAQDECTGCPLVPDCLTHPQAQRRTLNVGPYQEVLESARQRFAEPEQPERYHPRGEAVETGFGCVRGPLGAVRGWLRGAEKVAGAARLFQTAYQFRKVHRAWAGAGKRPRRVPPGSEAGFRAGRGPTRAVSRVGTEETAPAANGGPSTRESAAPRRNTFTAPLMGCYRLCYWWEAEPDRQTRKVGTLSSLGAYIFRSRPRPPPVTPPKRLFFPESRLMRTKQFC